MLWPRLLLEIMIDALLRLAILSEFSTSFFDLMNVRSLTEAAHERNGNKEPYRSPNDTCLKVIMILYSCML